MSIELGVEVRDKISGLVGTVVARTEYLNGRIQYAVMPKMKKGATEMPSWSIDESQLEETRKKRVKVKKRDTGGPTMKVKMGGVL